MLGLIASSFARRGAGALITDTVLADDPSQGITIRHGRSATLAVLMAQSPATALVHQDKLVKSILSQFGADHVSIVTNGVRSAGYLILDTVNQGTQAPTDIVTPFVRSIYHSSNDVKILLAQMISL